MHANRHRRESRSTCDRCSGHLHQQLGIGADFTLQDVFCNGDRQIGDVAFRAAKKCEAQSGNLIDGRLRAATA
jgi:hypothetical protein